MASKWRAMSCRRAASWRSRPVPVRSRSKARRRASRRSGMKAIWIPSERAERAPQFGLHSGRRGERARHASLRSDTPARLRAVLAAGRQELLDRVAASIPRWSRIWWPKLLTLAAVQKVMQNLLRERVSIRDAVSVLEALGEAAAATRNPILMTEYVRQAIRRSVVKPLHQSRGRASGVVSRPRDRAGGRKRGGARRAEQPPGAAAAGDPRHHDSHQRPRHIPGDAGGGDYVIERAVFPAPDRGIDPAKTCSSLAHNEIPPGLRVQSLGNIQ